MPQKLIEAYDTRTGAKLPHRVPENWTRIFPHVSATPTQKAADAAADATDERAGTTPKTARSGRQTPQKES